MMPNQSDAAPVERLERLLGYLQHDPSNEALLTDAVSTSFELRRFDVTAELLEGAVARGPLSPPLRNLQGLLALAEQRYDDAARLFGELRAAVQDEPGIRFNQAWALAMLERHSEAAELLDDDAVAASRRGPTLKVQMLHHLGDLDAALSAGERLAEVYPQDQALLGALADIAMDAEQPDLARRYAESAPDSASGLAVLGMLALEEQDSAKALSLFDRALAGAEAHPRALVGKGLALLSAGDTAAAAEAIDKGARLFGGHSGSWIAAGWAHFLANRPDQSRTCFERACEIDPGFSEGHGGLAVLDIVAGDIVNARRLSEVALRLDRGSLGGTLSRILLAQNAGDTQTAAALVQRALTTSLGGGGKSLIQLMVKGNTG